MSKQAPQQRQFPFTAKTLAALPPDPQRDYLVRDANTPGLALCVTKGAQVIPVLLHRRRVR